MKLTELYRRYSEEALEAARKTKHAGVKQEWLGIAEEWTALAAARLAIVTEKERAKERAAGADRRT